VIGQLPVSFGGVQLRVTESFRTYIIVVVVVIIIIIIVTKNFVKRSG